MEKKNMANKKPTQLDLRKMVAQGSIAEKAFKKEAIEKIQESEVSAGSIDILPESAYLSKDGQITSEVLTETNKKLPVDPPVAENPAVMDTEKHTEAEQQKVKEEQLVPAMDVPFEVFLKKYFPIDTDRRETVWVYTTNLKILKAIATSEDAPMIDIVNNIIAEWAKKYNKNIRKSLQKPSKMFGL